MHGVSKFGFDDPLIALNYETVKPADLPTKGLILPINGFESPKYENL